MVLGAKARALIHGRDYAIPEDLFALVGVRLARVRKPHQARAHVGGFAFRVAGEQTLAARLVREGAVARDALEAFAGGEGAHEGGRVERLEAGGAMASPGGMVHNEINVSPDFEALEVASPLITLSGQLRPPRGVTRMARPVVTPRLSIRTR